MNKQPQQQQHPQFRPKNFTKRKLNEDLNNSGQNGNNLGVIGRGLAKTRDYYSQNVNFAYSNFNTPEKGFYDNFILNN